MAAQTQCQCRKGKKRGETEKRQKRRWNEAPVRNEVDGSKFNHSGKRRQGWEYGMLGKVGITHYGKNWRKTTSRKKRAY